MEAGKQISAPAPERWTLSLKNRKSTLMLFLCQCSAMSDCCKAARALALSWWIFNQPWEVHLTPDKASATSWFVSFLSSPALWMCSLMETSLLEFHMSQGRAQRLFFSLSCLKWTRFFFFFFLLPPSVCIIGCVKIGWILKPGVTQMAEQQALLERPIEAAAHSDSRIATQYTHTHTSPCTRAA